MTSEFDLSTLFNPSSVCLIGASSDSEKLTGRPLDILFRHEYGGNVYVVNPRHTHVSGLKSYPSVGSLPEVPEVALVMVPANAVPASIDECGAVGVKYAVVLSSGFEEMEGAESTIEELHEVLDRHDLRIVGPNSEGIWAVPNRLILTFGSAALRDRITEGPVSVLSQSGSIGGGILRSLERRRIGCRYFVSVGNETSLTSMDYLDFIIEEGGSKVVLMFVEGLRDGGRLLEISMRAQEQRVQLVMLRGGKSEAGRVATASHTGKIASVSSVYASILRQCGVVQVDSIASLVDAAEVFTVAPPLRPAGMRGGVGVMGISGGSRSLVADACDQLEVPLADFSTETEAAIAEIVPAYGYPRNPTDVTGQVLSDPSMFSRTVDAISTDHNVQAVLVQYANRGPEQIQEDIDWLGEAAKSTGKPFIVSFLGEEIDQELRSGLLSRRILVASGPDVAVQYLGWMYQEATMRQRGAERGEIRAPAGRSFVTKDDLALWDGQARFLESCKVHVPTWQILTGDASVDSLHANFPFPVAVKAMPEDVQHKTELGLVRLDVQDLESLRATVSELRTRAGDGARILVQEMIRDGFEVIVTLRNDPDFGPVVAVGPGGTLVELLNEVTHVKVPCPAADIKQALSETRLRQLLAGFRGGESKDIPALLSAIEGLSIGYLSLDERPAEIEINPLLVRNEGKGVSAVDILVI